VKLKIFLLENEGLVKFWPANLLGDRGRALIKILPREQERAVPQLRGIYRLITLNWVFSAFPL